MAKKKRPAGQADLFSHETQATPLDAPAESLAPTSPPAQKPPKRRRTLKHSVEFEEGRVKGWALNIGECYRTALDIMQTERVVKVQTPEGEKKRRELVYTEGKPPLYSFAVGDAASSTPYPNDASQEHLLVQVLRATPDEWDAEEGKVLDGWLHVALYRTSNPEGWRAAGSVNITQRQFVEILRKGQVREHLQGGAT